MGIGSHAGFAYKDNFFFGAQSDGFKTKLQSMESLDTTGYQLLSDTYVFKYSPRYGLPSCLYNAEIDLKDIQRNDPPLFNYYEERKQYSPYCKNCELDFWKIDRSDKIFNQVINFFEGHNVTQGYVGDFDLLDSVKVPKPCAKTSAKPNENTTIPGYYVG